MTEADLKKLKGIAISLGASRQTLDEIMPKLDEGDDADQSKLANLSEAYAQIEAAEDILNELAEQPTESDD